MADGVEFDIKGLDSLLGKLAVVTYDLKRKGGRSALRRAAQLVADKAKEGAEKLDDSATGRSIAKTLLSAGMAGSSSRPETWASALG